MLQELVQNPRMTDYEEETHKNEIGKSRRECTGVQNQEEKHGQ